ncbi:hypothetical protein J4226_04810 [Candidatus Pacearchaeota archaeon]|nr:hypothetical protein [Candidatus Pacearchaeota archaeon]
MKMKKQLKTIAETIARDPLTEEIVDEEKKVLKRAIGKMAKRAKDKIKTK